MSREPASPPPGQLNSLPVARAAGEPGPRDYLRSARPYWRRAAAAVFLGTLLAAIVALVWPPTYKASTTLLPPTEEETGFSMTSVFRGLNIPGIKIPSRTGPEDVAVSVLSSRRVASALVRRFDLQRVYGIRSPENTIRKLQKRSGFLVNEAGAVIITVEDRTAQRAADLANAYAEELDRFNREVRMTKGRRMRLFVEKRLAETKRDMSAAEQALKEYSEKHSTIGLSPEQMSTVESAAQLFASQAALQTRIGMVREYATENSEDVRRLRQQLDQVNRQIAVLPNLGLDLARLLRDVKIQEQVYALLSAQYEEARITEARDVATVEVLDPAVPPERRAWPRRGLLVLIGFAASAALSLAGIAWSVRRTGRPV
jgi:tyrosine-protein kinase Etk/Wzc